jgi:hypothetical protein
MRHSYYNLFHKAFCTTTVGHPITPKRVNRGNGSGIRGQ